MGVRLVVPASSADASPNASDQFEAVGWLAVPAEHAARCEWGRRRFHATPPAGSPKPVR